MARPRATAAERRRGIVTGLFEGSRGEEPPPELRLARSLAIEVGRPELDLARVVANWLGAREGASYPDEVSGSLRWLADTGGPAPDLSFGPGMAASLVALPLVLRTCQSNRNVVSGAYHVARLLDPHPVGQWAAVAVSVVTACFLRGKLDFAADLIEALRANDAPSGLLAVARRVPIGVRGPHDPAPTTWVEEEIEMLFAVLFHQPSPTKARLAIRGSGRGPTFERLGAAMLGARDGVAGPSLSEELEDLLDRLDPE